MKTKLKTMKLIRALIFLLLPSVGGESNVIENFAQTAVLVRDVGYFLRNYKFNEYDRRFKDKSLHVFGDFPRPPLQQIHPQVKKFCGNGNFKSCLQYLHGVSLNQRLRRDEDTVTMIHQEGWTLPENETTILAADKSCHELKIQDEDWLDTAVIFQGPLERFQWRVSASYYMCWFTMKRQPELRHFMEPCDNFASCLDPKFGATNRDPRANDTVPFSCAQYSFCPDSCCPERHIINFEECHKSSLNPCKLAKSRSSSAAHLEAPVCSILPDSNSDLRSMQLNHWNHSCPCPDQGYIWDSRFAACVDIDECSHGGEGAVAATATCGGPQVSVCFNLIGAAGCVCRWGFTRNNNTGRCTPDLDLDNILSNFP